MPQILFHENTMTIELLGLQDADDDSYINNATVTVTITDEDDVDVVGETWPVTMTYVAASNGDYRANLSYLMDIDPRNIYTAKVTAIATGGERANWKYPLVAEERDFE